MTGLNYIGEARVKALEEAVKVAHQPRFHGSADNPTIVKFASKEIITLARDFEEYILKG